MKDTEDVILKYGNLRFDSMTRNKKRPQAKISRTPRLALNKLPPNSSSKVNYETSTAALVIQLLSHSIK